MDNSMEQRFVDRLLHTLATMSEYTPEAPVTAETATAVDEPEPRDPTNSH